MDSKPRRLPFTVSRTSSSYSSPSAYSSSSSSLGSLESNTLYGRSSFLNSDRFTRATSLKPDLNNQGSRYLGSTRDYSSADSRHASWKSPLTTSSVSYDRSWAESSLSSRCKLTDSERRLGTYSGLNSTTDDGDSKRVKLSYTNRATYTRSPSSVTGSSYSSSVLRDSEPLWSRREQEKRSEERGLSSFSNTSSHRSSGITSALYRPDRVTSTYAQGARPKETLYSSSIRESCSVSRHLSSTHQPSSLARDSTAATSRATGRSLSTSTPSSLRAPQKTPEPPVASSAPRPSSWYASPPAKREPLVSGPPAPLPGPTPEGVEVPDGRRSTRRLLSRLFSRRSSQDSSGSGSGSASRSFDSAEEAPAAGEAPGRAPLADGEESARPSSVPPVPRGSDAAQAFAFLRRRRQGLSPVQEGQNQRTPEAQPGLDAWRGGSVSSTGGSTSTGSSWLSSSIRSRCTPLFSRHRREGRDESAQLAGFHGTQFPVATGDAPEAEADEDEEDEEETAGAVAAASPGVIGASAGLQEELRVMAVRSQRLASVHDNLMIAMDMSRAAEGQAKEKPAPSRDPEKLRKIQESLLLEDSDEEEGDLCRICQMGEQSPSNPLIAPCRCTGSLQYVHCDCIKKWLRSKISSGTNLEAITTCELCKEKLHLNIENFDINELYRTHERSEYEFISCGLYLVVLLHLCEQRFSDVLGAANDAGFFNLARTLHEHMDNLESSYGESEEEAVDTRPSIDFCDLDEDLEEEYN
ncbi:E3 ubiquitin-protein ligase MARCH7 isoform X2 [Esox lucius]|uniref:RING-type E3 ubiquitin transferase n=1 Tax=Esox lucius TaxID=8010 RepID=A0AAY5KLJ4_ESOLU|nr:E3 ubiquitin-protein ligase MARCH7 isoform X2 [Esox lucius]